MKFQQAARGNQPLVELRNHDRKWNIDHPAGPCVLPGAVPQFAQF
jgi:hypothetical protein